MSHSRSFFPAIAAILLCGAAGRVGLPHTNAYGGPLPEGAVVRFGSIRLRHEITTGMEHFLAFAADGRTLFSCNYQTIRKWDCRTGKLLLEISGEEEEYFDRFVLSPGGQEIAVLTHDKSVYFWDAEKGKKLRQWQLDGFPERSNIRMSFSRDGKTLLLGNFNGLIQFRDTLTGRLQKRLQTQEPLFGLRLSRDAKTLTTWNWKRVVRWDVASGKERSDTLFPQPRWRKMIANVDLSVFALYTEGKDLVFWDARRGKVLHKLKATGLLNQSGMAFTPDGKELLTTEWSEKTRKGRAKVWAVATGKIMRSFAIPAYSHRTPVFSKDAKTVILDADSPAITLWDYRTGKVRLTSAGHLGPIHSLAFTSDGKKIITTDQQKICVWDPASSKLLRTLEEPWRTPLVVAVDNQTVLVVRYRPCDLRLVQLSTGKTLRSFPIPAQSYVYHKNLYLSADGKLLLAITAQRLMRKLHVWDLRTGKVIESRGLRQDEPDDAFVSGGDCLAGMMQEQPSIFKSEGGLPPSLSDRLIVRDRKNSHLRMGAVLPGDTGFALAETPDQQALVTVCLSGLEIKKGSAFRTAYLQVWETATGSLRLEIQRKASRQEYFSQVCLSPDGRTIATVWDNEIIELWDYYSAKRLLRRSAGTEVNVLRFSPDGCFLATGLNDGTALLWDVHAITGRKHPARLLSTEQAKKSWDDLGRDAKTAHAAAGRLLGDPHKTLALFRKQLQPAPPLSAAKMQKLIAQLDSEKFRIRSRAEKELHDLGHRAERALRAAFKKNLPLEVHLRIQKLLDGIWKIRAPAALRRLRAVAVLEQIHTSEAQALLTQFSRGDPEARETKAAKGALRRLDKRK